MSGAFHTIDAANAPSLGDIRIAGPDDLIYVMPTAVERKDFPKYWEAIGVAKVRGALVHVMNREEKQ
ncbi:hypothetical protein GCM10009548_02150 [Streptomyces malaysiensis subsp. malaysiensis]|uniref:Uncharacterized protein n=1 Tax=Streptomyces malaysiensis TaxID=92644 RepID=A0ABX6W4D5_STRMQ|nr:MULTISPECIES: hypothetical protein [Streptomyces]QPI56322.1 hypothetical protein I1A49_16475 [Streptomyces solisilvae]UHH17807.1 hypothetical protein LUV23_16590 [Streptomyces sp. HNM0561]